MGRGVCVGGVGRVWRVRKLLRPLGKWRSGNQAVLLRSLISKAETGLETTGHLFANSAKIQILLFCFSTLVHFFLSALLL